MNPRMLVVVQTKHPLKVASRPWVGHPICRFLGSGRWLSGSNCRVPFSCASPAAARGPSADWNGSLLGGTGLYSTQRCEPQTMGSGVRTVL